MRFANWREIKAIPTPSPTEEPLGLGKLITCPVNPHINPIAWLPWVAERHLDAGPLLLLPRSNLLLGRDFVAFLLENQVASVLRLPGWRTDISDSYSEMR
jgi:hypothetical protein